MGFVSFETQCFRLFLHIAIHARHCCDVLVNVFEHPCLKKRWKELVGHVILCKSYLFFIYIYQYINFWDVHIPQESCFVISSPSGLIFFFFLFIVQAINNPMTPNTATDPATMGMYSFSHCVSTSWAMDCDIKTKNG